MHAEKVKARIKDTNSKKQTLQVTNRSVRPTQDDFGVEEGAGYAGGDGNQFPLAAKDFDLTSAREVGEINGASVADAGSGQFVDGHRRKIGKQFARMDEYFL